MAYKKTIKKVASKLPITKQYLNQRHLKYEVKVLRGEVKHLTSRNQEWEQEVRQMRGEAKALPIVWPVAPEDLKKATLPAKPQSKTPAKKGPYTINWVLPPMGLVSGGHSDIFRTIQFLENQGHSCRIYYYDPQKASSLSKIKELMKNYPKVNSELYYNEEFKQSDAIFATNWFSAYPVYNAKNVGKKFYYVQDFEPFFDPIGTYSTLADNTYKFGFYGVTLGKWLTQKLSREYGMKCDYFDLGVDSREYSLVNKGERKKILFYARPVTPRRGFELGILALEIFHEQHPEYEINFLGWDITPYQISFPYVNNGILPAEKLNELYNECRAGLVLSFTNMSLLPLEMLAAGCVPIVNSAEHTNMASYSSELDYAEPTPQDLANALHKAVTRADADKHAENISKVTKKFEWDDSNKKVEQIITRELSK
ncbi:MAG: glycosyltransferase family 1 protein [Candidatus Saccharibacteria bacterium]|nr:glycosyltransferase family 1 protein [Candidatus Saccharibacteria bacterium]